MEIALTDSQQKNLMAYNICDLLSMWCWSVGLEDSQLL